MGDRGHASARPAGKTLLNLGNLPPKQMNFAMDASSASYPRTASRVDPNNPPWPAYRGYHEYSFAHETMGKRLPTILGNAMTDVIQTLNEQWDEEKVLDLLRCLDRMHILMKELQDNAELRPIIDDDEGDIPLWNKAIAKYFRGKDFMSAPWLFAEAYKYRRLHECFSLSRYWSHYDVFFRQKCDTFSRSSTAVFELSTRFALPQKQDSSLSLEEAQHIKKLLFLELTQVSLWGNATDLSLLINMTEDDIKKIQSTGGDHLAATEKNILGNHLQRVWELVANMKGGRIDFVLDNAGFELYCDCVYADWLIQSGIAREVHFHGKRIPWFVSDVTRKDWNWLLNVMAYGSLFPGATRAEEQSLRELGKRWKQYVNEGKWIYEQHPFWCTGYTFWSISSEAPDLFHYLCESDLVIFKGDLNHRKLTYDCQAPSDTPFDVAIGPLASEEGAPPVLSLRTVKSDVVVDVPLDVSQKLDKDEPGWRISGKYAVVLLSDGDRKDKTQEQKNGNSN
ncbi:hypothetical protein MPSI1_000642 [Malassezia psittaci]|uniref:Sugar phosphate phosphatase n=1 Tax=Malassezia psittaci TaxID=1821823 RepID=A0AAF0F6Y1_9BASI|nr:hypothetical protein MPSI1_000642 [Malassezia psittaci]